MSSLRGLRFGLCLGLVLAASAPSNSVAGLLCIDPGHGGTDPGALSLLPGFNEKAANLKVALLLYDTLNVQPHGQAYCLTWDDPSDPYLSLDERAAISNENFSDWFICIHHNAETTTWTANYTRAYYWTSTETDSGWSRSNDSVLATKVGIELHRAFQLSYSCRPNELPCIAAWAVLRLTQATSVYTEASFITNLSEAYRLRDSARAAQEAGAIFHGWRSYVNNGGFAVIENAYSGGGYDGSVTVDYSTKSSPHIDVWEQYENHVVSVPSTIYAGGHERTFYRWAEIGDYLYRRDSAYNLWDLSYNLTRNVEVDIWSAYHYIIAYYKGGPYEATVARPADTVYVGQSVTTEWTTDVGADSTTWIHIKLDRDNGAGGYPETFAGPGLFDWVDSYDTWTVTGPPASSARLKILAHDYAGNVDTEISQPFVIFDCGTLTVSGETMSTNAPAITQVVLNYSADKPHKRWVNVYRNGQFLTQLHQDTTYGAGSQTLTWILPDSLQGKFRKYRFAGHCTYQCGSSGPALSDTLNDSLDIKNQLPTILQPPFLYLDRFCVEYGQNTCLIRAFATDFEDQTNLSYSWRVKRGTFSNGLKTCDSCPNEVTYVSPAQAPFPCYVIPEGQTNPPETVWVDVRDSDNGVTTQKVKFNLRCVDECGTQPTCNCAIHGDVSPAGANGGDGVLNVLDVTYLINAAFRGGLAPLWIQRCPVSRGDLVDYGAINVLDVSELVDVVFRGQPWPTNPCGGQ